VDDRGFLYAEARDRLIAQLTQAQGDADAIRKLLAPFKDADVVPASEQLERLSTRIRHLRGRLQPMQAALADSARLDALAARRLDELRHRLAALDDDASALSAPRTRGDLTAFRAAARVVQDHLDEADDTMLRLTIGHRVREQLHCLRVGRSLDFKQMFPADRLPAKEQRTAMLEQLERDNCYLDEGVVDVRREIIWRRSGSAAVRTVSALSPIAFAVLGWLVLWVATMLRFPDELRLDDASELLRAYVLVLFGVAAHLLVENVKLSQDRSVPILAIGEFVDWLHLRWAAIGATFFFVVVTVVGIRATNVVGDIDEALLYFFAGYSVDSVAGVFLNRFGTAARAGVTTVSAAIGAPAAGGAS